MCHTDSGFLYTFTVDVTKSRQAGLTNETAYKQAMNRTTWYRGWPLELIFWVSALVVLFFGNPEAHHLTLCPLALVGFDWCPGCGLGRSITLLLHGRLEASVAMHWLGIPATLVIVYRIYQLTKSYHHEQS